MKFKNLFRIVSVFALITSNSLGSEIGSEDEVSMLISGTNNKVYFSDKKFNELKEKYSDIYKSITPNFPYNTSEQIFFTENGEQNFIEPKEKMAFIPQNCAYIPVINEVALLS